MTDEQAQEWWAVVNRLPAEWFPRETHGMLAQYCRHIVRARRVAQLLSDMEKSKDFEPAEYRELLRAEAEQSKIIASLATKRDAIWRAERFGPWNGEEAFISRAR